MDVAHVAVAVAAVVTAVVVIVINFFNQVGDGYKLPSSHTAVYPLGYTAF